MGVQRYDKGTLKAVKTDEGFIVDSPIVSRIGIQEYTLPDGTKRRELRLPEDVFHPDSLASMRAKPITVEHPPAMVNSKNASRHTVGSILSAGVQDGEHVRAEIVIHSPSSIGDRRELSLGYLADMEEAPGMWNGQAYDAVQRNIRVNHLSVVKKGRAGVAKLNLDGAEVVDQDFQHQDFQQPEQLSMTTVKVRLDTGLEYDAAPEVAAELVKLRKDASEAALRLQAIPKIEAERDGLKAKVDAFPEQLQKAQEQGRKDAAERLNLEATAARFKVDCAGKTDRQVKEAVIKSVTKDVEFSDKSDEYVDARFDFSLESVKKDSMSEQRLKVNAHTDAAPAATGAAGHAQKRLDELRKMQEAERERLDQKHAARKGK